MRLIRPDAWNRVAQKIAAKKNKSYHGSESGGWRHPWQTACRWDPRSQSWAMQMQPGYVNAAETDCPPLSAELAPAATRARLGIAAGGRQRQKVTPWLSEGPWIPINPALWREIGTGAVESETVPAFFVAALRKGVFFEALQAEMSRYDAASIVLPLVFIVVSGGAGLIAVFRTASAQNRQVRASTIIIDPYA